MRPFSPEVSRDKWAYWWVYRRVGLTCPWLLSISSSNGWPGFQGEETGKDRPPPISQVSLGAEGLPLSCSSQNRSRGFCGSWGRGLVSVGKGKAYGRQEGRGPTLEATLCALQWERSPCTPFLCPLTSLSPEPRSMFTQSGAGMD